MKQAPSIAEVPYFCPLYSSWNHWPCCFVPSSLVAFSPILRVVRSFPLTAFAHSAASTGIIALHVSDPTQLELPSSPTSGSSLSEKLYPQSVCVSTFSFLPLPPLLLYGTYFNSSYAFIYDGTGSTFVALTKL